MTCHVYFNISERYVEVAIGLAAFAFVLAMLLSPCGRNSAAFCAGLHGSGSWQPRDSRSCSPFTTSAPWSGS
jgi:hypothetical protein